MRTARERMEFIRLPFHLYDGDPHWVAPLIAEMKEKIDPSRHPFFEAGEVRFFLALRAGRAVGRVAAVIDDAHNRFHDDRAVAFGLFEFEKDPEVAVRLLKKVAAFGKERAMERIRGPLSYSTNEECGVLVEGFDLPPVVMMPYNPPWYGEILEGAGLRKGRDLLAFRIEPDPSFERIARLAGKAAKRHGLSVRPLDMKRFKAELETVRKIYNDSWEKNWGFVPMSPKAFDWQARKLRPVIEPGLALIVERDGDPAGFSLALPDLNQAIKKMKGRLFPFGLLRFLFHRRKITGIRVMAMGIRPAYRSMGAEGLLIHGTIENGLARGHGWAELSWVLEDNEAMCRLAEKMGAKAYKRYRIYENALDDLSW